MAKKWTKTKYTNDRNGGIDLADELLKNIRPQDRDDLIATGGDIIFEICGSLQACKENYVYRGEHGELLCIMGISGYMPDAPGRCVYMFGTNALDNFSYYKQLLVIEARNVIGKWVRKYGIVFNAVNIENEKSRRWLTRLGAVWLPEKIETVRGTFLQFIITEGSFKNV